MTKPQSQTQVEVPDGPAIVTADHLQDRELSPVAGAPRGYRRLDGLAWMAEEAKISQDQYEAGRRLQTDYALSQCEAGAQSNMGGKVDGRRSYDLPDHAIDASRRVERAMSVLPPQLLSIVTMFLFPDLSGNHVSLGEIAKRVGRHQRVISFGVETALSLLARHYAT